MLRVTVHVSNELRAREAVACGADTLAHPVIQSPVTAELLWLLAARRIPVVSTLAIGERYFRLADDPSFLDEQLYAACIEPEERERLRTDEHRMQLTNRWADWMRVMTPVAQENLRSLVEAGGVVVTGTDLSLGAELRREMQLLQAAGITPWEVLRCGTVNGAAFLGKEREMGSVAVGKVADLVLVDEDPTLDVSHLDTVSMVVKDGHVVDRTMLKLPGNVNGAAGYLGSRGQTR
jgi:imidazolonepropionase-like amidohydrolase